LPGEGKRGSAGRDPCPRGRALGSVGTARYRGAVT
jgi:hypothetical protein